MSAQSSVLEQLQVDIANRLQADSFFSNIPVYIMRPRENLGFTQIQNLINNTLTTVTVQGGKGGIAVIVMIPTADSESPDVPGPRLTFIPVVRVQELPIINMGPNGTLKTCEQVALYVLNLLHLVNLGNGNVLVAANDALTPSDAFDPKLTIDCKFNQMSGLSAASKCAGVLMVPRSGSHSQSVTLTCSTGGSAIYYTTDGSYPSPTNGTLYSAPFTPAASGTIRAAASASGFFQSDVSNGVFT